MSSGNRLTIEDLNSRPVVLITFLYFKPSFSTNPVVNPSILYYSTQNLFNSNFELFGRSKDCISILVPKSGSDPPKV